MAVQASELAAFDELLVGGGPAVFDADLAAELKELECRDSAYATDGMISLGTLRTSSGHNFCSVV